MDKNKENGICMVRQNMLKYPQEVINTGTYHTNLFNKVYRDISDQLGIEAAIAIHQMFKGTQISFPIRFLDNQCVKEMIVKEYNGSNVKMLAKKYDYSEKTIRRIIKENLKKKGDKNNG